MFANGFTAELLIELVRAGDASAHAERMVAGGRSHRFRWRTSIRQTDGIALRRSQWHLRASISVPLD
jgi:hypothetical protein